MVGPEAATEMAVLPGMVEVKTGIGPSGVVSDPVSILVYVRCLGMTRLIGEVTVLFDGVGIAFRLWAARRRRMHLTAAMALIVFAMLRERQETKHKGNCEKSQTSLHPQSSSSSSAPE
jgi:hypothetical protein